MAKRIEFKDQNLKALKAAEPGKRYEIADVIIPKLRVRVTDKADPSRKGNYATQRTFVLLDRFPGSNNPTRRALGEYPMLTIKAARDKAREWLDLIGRGIDPAAVVQQQQEVEAERRENSFAATAEKWISAEVIGPDEAHPKQRQGRRVAARMRNEAIARLGNKPMDAITRKDLIAVVDAVAARSPSSAHNLRSDLNTFFIWAISKDIVESNPAQYVKSGYKKSDRARDRWLDDDEIVALWKATREIGFPYGLLVRLLALTGCRLREIAGAKWGELHPDMLATLRRADGPIDWAAVDNRVKEIRIPPERFKAKVAHVVPLSDAACRLLESLPVYDNNDHIFASDRGLGHFWAYSKGKERLDKIMLRYLKAMARKRGANPDDVTLQPWVIHNLRTSLRTNLARPEMMTRYEVAEAAIGHGKKGLERTYLQFNYEDELRAAYNKWADRIEGLLTPPQPSNIVQLRTAE